MPPHRKTSHLARHRVSLPGARYFVTLCTEGRIAGLTSARIANGLLDLAASCSNSGDAAMICAVIMPDHIHWIFVLGDRITLSQVIAKWKVATAPLLTEGGISWQKNFFEHRLRPEENVESYAFYVFMNPHTAGLPENGAAWPWWRKGDAVSFRFEDGLRADGVPPPEWNENPDARGSNLSVGE